MKILAFFIVLYVSPGCLSQCVNCAPQPTYQSPCCVPTSNVQTIQTARAFTNGAQGSQVVMYYNGQRVVAGQQPQQQQQPGSNFNQANNYQNPGPIPAPGYQTGYDQNQNLNQSQQGYNPNNLGGGVVAGGATTGTVVVGGVGTQGNQGGQPVNVGGNVGGQNQNINAGGVVGDPNQSQYQNQNLDPYQNQQNINAGGVIGNQNQNQNQGQFQNQDQFQNQNPNMNAGGYIGDQNQNQGPYQNQNQDSNINAGGYMGDQNQNQGGQFQDQNQNNYPGQYQGSTLSPSGGEVGYQPFEPSGNNEYNNGAQGQLGQQQQGQQGQQGQFQQNQNNQQGQFPQNQNDQQVIYPTGGAVAGGAVTGSSYNSPNSGYVNSQVQPQTYPTQTVTGGAIPNQNVQQQPDMNTQYQDQMNQQNQQNMGQQNMGQQPNFQGNQQQQPRGFAGSTTPQQGQQFTNAPNGQYQQSTIPQGQQGFTNQQPNQQGIYPGSSSTSTPGYQQGEFLTEGSGFEENEFLGQQQFTTSPTNQQGFINGQQGYTENTLTPPIENEQNDSVPFTQAPMTQQQAFETPTPSQTPSTSTPYPVIYPAPVAGQQQQQTPSTQPFQPNYETSPYPENPTSTQSPYPVIYPVPSVGQETQGPIQQTSTVSSNQDEFGTSSQSQNDAVVFSTTQNPNFVPILVPVPQNGTNGNVSLESSSTVPVQNDSGTIPVTGSTTSGPFTNGAQGQSGTNSFQSTTPTTTTNFNNGQPSNGFQSTTGMPVTNDNNQAGFIASSTMDPNMPQAQYPSQQEILAATGQQADQSATSGANMVSTQAPQFPSQQELGATLQNTQPTSAPQFPAQQELGASTGNFNGQQGGSTQQSAGVTPQFPSQQELIQRDQQNPGATGQNVNTAGFTPQYGDMNTPYGRYASTTASSNPQFDQPIADQQQPQNSAGNNFKIFISTLMMVILW